MLMTLWFGQEDSLLTAGSITDKASLLHPRQTPGCLALAASKAPAGPPVFTKRTANSLHWLMLLSYKQRHLFWKGTV